MAAVVNLEISKARALHSPSPRNPCLSLMDAEKTFSFHFIA